MLIKTYSCYQIFFTVSWTHFFNFLEIWQSLSTKKAAWENLKQQRLQFFFFKFLREPFTIKLGAELELCVIKSLYSRTFTLFRTSYMQYGLLGKEKSIQLVLTFQLLFTDVSGYIFHSSKKP